MGIQCRVFKQKLNYEGFKNLIPDKVSLRFFHIPLLCQNIKEIMPT